MSTRLSQSVSSQTEGVERRTHVCSRSRNRSSGIVFSPTHRIFLAIVAAFRVSLIIQKGISRTKSGELERQTSRER